MQSCRSFYVAQFCGSFAKGFPLGVFYSKEHLDGYFYTQCMYFYEMWSFEMISFLYAENTSDINCSVEMLSHDKLIMS